MREHGPFTQPPGQAITSMKFSGSFPMPYTFRRASVFLSMPLICFAQSLKPGIFFVASSRTASVTPQLRAIDSINPQDEAFGLALRGGVTTACTGPGSANVVGGTFAAIKLVGDRVDNMIVKSHLFVFFCILIIICTYFR